MKHASLTRSPFVQESAEVVAQESVSSRYFRLRLKSPGVAVRAKPGQFVMLACRPDTPNQTDPLLPRPLALLDADAQSGVLELLYFVAGRGTALLQAAVGSCTDSPSGCASLHRDARQGLPAPRLRIIGPLGNGFEPVPDCAVHIAVGGGSGVAPLAFFFRRWPQQVQGERHLILAARAADQLARTDVVAARDATLHEATDDGSRGFKGNAIACLQGLLDGPLKGKRVAIYAAGPDPMMAAAGRLARERGLPCRVSLESRMGCGVGVCRSCVVDGLTPHPKTGLKRRTVCQDGPVFDPCELAGRVI